MKNDDSVFEKSKLAPAAGGESPKFESKPREKSEPKKDDCFYQGGCV